MLEAGRAALAREKQADVAVLMRTALGRFGLVLPASDAAGAAAAGGAGSA